MQPEFQDEQPVNVFDLWEGGPAVWPIYPTGLGRWDEQRVIIPKFVYFYETGIGFNISKTDTFVSRKMRSH